MPAIEDIEWPYAMQFEEFLIVHSIRHLFLGEILHKFVSVARDHKKDFMVMLMPSVSTFYGGK
jgi:hypothetical protein